MVERKDMRFTGGCQCGAVRYALSAAPDNVCVCHCRMCQKASGGPLMAFARVRNDQLGFSRGRPAAFRSSSLVERHFCSTCGTPLTYNFLDSDFVHVTVGSLDDPEAVRPAFAYGIERRLSWFSIIEHLPGQRTEELIARDLAARFVNRQHPDHET